MMLWIEFTGVIMQSIRTLWIVLSAGAKVRKFHALDSRKAGASRGIDRVIAQKFAEDGHDIIAVAHDNIKLEQFARELHDSWDTRMLPVAVDLDQFKSSAAEIRRVLEDVGRLDIIVHSAGIFRFGTGEISMADFQALLSTNVLAVHNINQIGLPYLRTAPKPRLFAIASITGVEPFAPVGGYASSKHALVGYIRSIARQESENGVRVTAICTDVVDTDMAAGSGMPQSQMIKPIDIANVIKLVMSLSPAVTLDQITIGCNPIPGSVRDTG